MNPAIFDDVRAGLADRLEGASVAHGLLQLEVGAAAAAEVAERLKSGYAFDMLLDVTAVDWPGREPRFDVVWHFYSTKHHVRVRVKARVAEASPEVATLVPLFNSARYMERECHEMYGIAFRGNPDLRPLLLYEGFVGHPLRKDYAKRHEQPLVPYRDLE